LCSFLKAFLHVFELDKPFTGGIGSFKLYIMIAAVVQNCLKVAKGSQLDTGFILLAFFRVYGNPKNLNKLTVLSHMGLSVDFSGNFQAGLCCLAFDWSYKAVEKMLDPSRHTASSSSILRSVIHCHTLQRSRDKSLQYCNSFPMHSSEEKNAIGEGKT